MTNEEKKAEIVRVLNCFLDSLRESRDDAAGEDAVVAAWQEDIDRVAAAIALVATL